LGQKGLNGTNTSAYSSSESWTAPNSFLALTPDRLVPEARAEEGRFRVGLGELVADLKEG